jgi:hypothetical protein
MSRNVSSPWVLVALTIDFRCRRLFRNEQKGASKFHPIPFFGSRYREAAVGVPSKYANHKPRQINNIVFSGLH